MKKSTWLFLITIVLVTGISAFYGMRVKSSFVDDVHISNIEEELDNYRVTVKDDQGVNDVYYDYHIKDTVDLKDKSPLIIKAKKVDKSAQVHVYNMMTEVEVIDVKKGSEFVSVNDRIFVHEPSSIIHDYYSGDGYMNLLYGEEYLLFLQPLKVPDGYDMSEEEKKQFIFVSPTYGKYAWNDSKVEQVITKEQLDEGDGQTYAELKHLDIIATSQEMMDRYNSIKADLRKEM
jgi:hypothetical protein